MRSPKISAKRALGLSMAAALAVAGTVAVAGSSEAAVTIQALKLSTATGNQAGGTIVSITGKDFQSAAGTSKIGAVYFSTSTCAVANKTTNPATPISVTSATKIVVTSPALALTGAKPTAYNLCVDDASDATVIGTAKFTSYYAPLINTTVGGTNGLSTASGPSYGGTSVTITGENFTTKSTASIGGKPLTNVKVVVGTATSQSADAGDDTITGLVPGGTTGTAAVAVTNEGGTVIDGGAGVKDFTYMDAVKVSPSFGDGTANNVITLTGVGFLGKSFPVGAAVVPTTGKSAVVFEKAGAALTAASLLATATTGTQCANVQVVSDTELNCQLPAFTLSSAAGGYTIQVVTGGATAFSGGVTAVSTSASYTVAAF
jgi:hypothetical protein